MWVPVLGLWWGLQLAHKLVHELDQMLVHKLDLKIKNKSVSKLGLILQKTNSPCVGKTVIVGSGVGSLVGFAVGS